jgi:hypothetical protein
MKKVSQLWEQQGRQLLPGQEGYEKSNHIDELTPSEDALDCESGDAPAAAVTMVNSSSPALGPPGFRAPVSLAQTSGMVQDFLDNWVTQVCFISLIVGWRLVTQFLVDQANRVAKTFSCEMILFTVSKYLGPHAFQLTTTTHGATPFLQIADDLDGPNTYGTRFHAWTVGHTTDYICSLHDQDPPSHDRSIKVTARMARLIGQYLISLSHCHK